jgi:hypothetical protein
MIVIGVILGAYKPKDVFPIFKDLLPIAISIVAVYLAHIFQQRSMFVQSLRSLWTNIIESKNELLSYANLPEPQMGDYAKAYRAIAAAIDEMRGVYQNVGEDRHYVGYFPYEPLHDMRKALKELGHENVTDSARKRTWDAIQQAWLSMRFSFLNEFDTPEPTNPILVAGTWRNQEPGSSPRRGEVELTPPGVAKPPSGANVPREAEPEENWFGPDEAVT